MTVKFFSTFNLTSANRLLRHAPAQACMACGQALREESALCGKCLGDLPLVRNPCGGCGLPLAVAAPRCAACLRQPWHFHRCRIPFVYAAPVDVLIRRMKFDSDLRAARLLGRLMAAQFAHERVHADCIVPVPLHPRRLVARGYNQSLLLAGQIADAMRIPLLRSACVRIRATLPQTGVEAVARRSNVRGAFAAPECVNGLRIALVDDVMTSGQTAEAAALALKKAGAASVSLWACARAGLGVRV
jgi:ComF family protein